MKDIPIYFESKPDYWVGDYPCITIHYREGDEISRDMLSGYITDALKRFEEERK